MKRSFILLIAVAIVVTPAISCSTAELDVYVQADKATFQAISGEYIDLVNGSDRLDDDQKKRRLRTVQSWKKRIEAAEKNE